MSDPTQPPREDEPNQPPQGPPPSSPFPESSLGPETPAPAPAPGPGAPRPAAQEPPAPGPAAPPASTPGGMQSGDPLWGTTPAPADTPAPGSSAPPGAYPPGYSSPAPPGAGGSGMSPAFSSAPAPGTYVLAGWWQRVGAAIIDGLIITVVAMIFIIPLGIGVGSTDSDTGTAALVGAFLLTLIVFAVVGLFYAPVMMSRTNGQTLGRMATGIRVIRAGGEPITFGFAALREIVVKTLLVGAVSSATAGIGYLIDVLWPLWDDENRALHDFVVNTRSVKT